MITLYGVTEDGTSVPVQVTEDGKLIVHKDESFEPGDDLVAGDIQCDNITTTTDGRATIGGNANANVANKGINLGLSNAPGAIYVRGDVASDYTGIGLAIAKIGEVTNRIELRNDGTGTFKSIDGITLGNGLGSSDTWRLIPSDGGIAGAFQIYDSDTAKGIKIRRDGGITAAGSFQAADNKCGFTSEGELVFTSRGDRYKLIIQGNMLYPDPYPISKQLQEKADQLREPKTQDIVPPTE